MFEPKRTTLSFCGSLLTQKPRATKKRRDAPSIWSQEVQYLEKKSRRQDQGSLLQASPQIAAAEPSKNGANPGPTRSTPTPQARTPHDAGQSACRPAAAARAQVCAGSRAPGIARIAGRRLPAAEPWDACPTTPGRAGPGPPTEQARRTPHAAASGTAPVGRRKHRRSSSVQRCEQSGCEAQSCGVPGALPD